MTRKAIRLTSLALASFTMACLAACGGEPASQPTDTTEAGTNDGPVDLAPTSGYYVIDQGIDGGLYQLEKTHASLVWTVSHNGLSKYTARFTDFDAEIILDAGIPADSRLFAEINPLSVRTDHPSGPDWDQTLGNDEKWFNAGEHPVIRYESTDIKINGTGPGKTIADIDGTGIIEGNLNFLGVTKQVPLNVTFNGVRNFPYYGDRDVLGFSATATLKRSDFGMTALLPSIGDEVTLTIEAEFLYAE